MFFVLFTLKSLLSSQIATIFKHVARFGMQSPETAFAWLVRSAGYFQKTIVKAEAMAYGILPTLLIISIVGKHFHDELINFGQGQHFRIALLNGHRYQTDVRVWWFGMSVVTTSVRFLSTSSIKQAVRFVQIIYYIVTKHVVLLVLVVVQTAISDICIFGPIQSAIDSILSITTVDGDRSKTIQRRWCRRAKQHLIVQGS